jgi:hypothetical protein
MYIKSKMIGPFSEPYASRSYMYWAPLICLLVDKMFVLITLLHIELTEKIPFCCNSHLNTYVTSLEYT